MTNVVKEKGLRCIQWTVTTPNSNVTLTSESFLFQCLKCHLKLLLRFNKNYSFYLPSDLFFIPDGQLQLPINILVRIADCSRTYITKSGTITSIETVGISIWNTSECGLPENTLLTIDVIIDDLSTNDIRDVTAACNASEEIKKSTKSSKIIHLETLSRDFSNLVDESSNFDVDITCEGKIFKAHRNVLETRSTVFAAMLKSDMVEGKTGTIKLEDITASIFENFLRYLYSGTLPDLSIDIAKQYYKAADKYAVEELKQTCSEFLTKNLSEGNAYEVLVLADQHRDENFRNDVIAYIVEKKILLRDKQWPHFYKKYPILAEEVIIIFRSTVQSKFYN